MQFRPDLPKEDLSDEFRIVGSAQSRKRPPNPKSLLSMERSNPNAFLEVREEANTDGVNVAEDVKNGKPLNNWP